MFGVSANDNVNGVSNPTLEPGIYKGKLMKVSFETPKKDDGTELVKRLVFQYHEEGGGIHTHIEYDTDDAKKGKNMSLRITHIMSKYIDRAMLNQQHGSFSEYANWVVSMLNGKTASTPVKFMVVGNVYNGKATANFPGYLPFVVREGEALDFDANHKDANAKYWAHMKGGATSGPDSESTAGNGGSKAVDADF